jgi:hypothetical protein
MKVRKVKLEQVADELETYCPDADEYKGIHIHPYWAKRIREAITKLTNLGEAK